MGAHDGMGIVLFGGTGGGKSLLLSNGYKIVGGIEREHVAEVPHSIDLTVARLIGEETPTETIEVGPDGAEYRKSLTAVVRSIITPNSRVVQFDESNRTNQLAIQSALKILQDGGIRIYDESGLEVDSETFDLVVFAENNYGTKYTFRTDPALINRRAMGAFVGERPPRPEEAKQRDVEVGDRSRRERRQDRRDARALRKAGDVSGKHVKDGTPAAEQPYVPRLSEGAKWVISHPNEEPRRIIPVSPVIDRSALLDIRKNIHNVKYGTGQQALTERMVSLMLDKIEDDADLESADVRISKQVRRIAQTLAMFDKNVETPDSAVAVSDLNILEAVNYAMTARMASMEMKAREVTPAINEVLGRAYR
ncbi:MAG: hypothetical protein WDN66_00305 [Candidatus Saccharibacteria bacterium]